LSGGVRPGLGADDPLSGEPQAGQANRIARTGVPGGSDDGPRARPGRIRRR
jgi:hypothetical protein